MSALPPIQRLITEDFQPEQRKWLPKLFQPINQFFESVYGALNKGLTIADNISGEIKTIEVNGTYPLKLSWGQKSKPVAVIVGNAYRSDGTSVTLSSAVYCQWQFNQSSQLQIDGVVGISPTDSEKYKVLIVCFTG